jgi:uncharacterized membrane protein YfcA
VATPLLSLAVGVKTAVAISIVPNIVMDFIQVVRRGGVLASVRRLGVLLLFGLVGTFVGTRLLTVLSPRVATMVLGAFVLLFVGLNVAGIRPHIPAWWERWLSPPIGFFAGVLGGLTNVPGTPLVIYFQALGVDKHEFVRSVALAFMTYKIVQLGAVTWYGLLTWPLLLASVALTALGLCSFAVGLRLQDWLPERIFNGGVMTFLALVGIWLIARSL